MPLHTGRGEGMASSILCQHANPLQRMGQRHAVSELPGGKQLPSTIPVDLYQIKKHSALAVETLDSVSISWPTNE